MTLRETVEGLRPNASGTASAQISYWRQDRPCRIVRKSPASAARGCSQLLGGTQRDLCAPQPIPDSLIGDRECLIEQGDRPALVGAPDGPWEAAAALVPLACQRSDLSLQGLCYGLKPQGDERLDQRNLGIQILECGHLAQRLQAHVFDLALSLNSHDSFMERLLLSCGCGVSLPTPLHHAGATSSILN